MYDVAVLATAAIVGGTLVLATAREVSGWTERSAWVNPPARSAGEHPYRRKTKSGAKVTPVVGTILMVAITVVLAAVLYVMVTSL